MKIAVLQRSGSVGSFRWTYALFSAIKRIHPEADISLFIDDMAACPKDLLCHFQNAKIGIEKCKLPKFVPLSRAKKNYNFFHSIIRKYRLLKLAKIVNTYDVVFYSWPYGMKPLDLNIPSVFIPHDFIFTHFFGLHVGNVYNYANFINTKENVSLFTKRGSIPCVSSNYICNEFKRTFPHYDKEINVVRLPSMDCRKSVSADVADKILDKFGLTYKYILLATNDMHHKNMEEALTAYYWVKQKHPDYKMIIIGWGTAGIRVKMNSPYYADHVDEEDDDCDIRGLGLVSDEELVVLIKNAEILLNVSLCEAACGSGGDAWQLGTPTAISDIPPYKEHVEFLGVKTEFFNPKNSEDIARAMLKLIEHPEIAEENARISKKAIESRTIDEAAEQYYGLFEQIVKDGCENKNLGK